MLKVINMVRIGSFDCYLFLFFFSSSSSAQLTIFTCTKDFETLDGNNENSGGWHEGWTLALTAVTSPNYELKYPLSSSCADDNLMMVAQIGAKSILTR
jgi:hypothetical protein